LKYRAQAPLRVDFAGGWSDVPAFAQAEGGAVLNAAISIYAKGYIIWGGGWQAGIAGRLLGAEKNVVRYELDAPAGAGLGASAAQTLLWLTLVKTTIANVSERRELAERAWRVEQELGILGGKQDHYASAVGGISYMRFGSGPAEVEELKPGFPFTDGFERRLVLVYTGRRRLSSDIHEAVWGRYRSGDTVVAGRLARLRDIAGEMRNALMAHDLDAFAELMAENWACQQKLHASVTNAEVNALVALALRSGAQAVKATGAGGGGCLLCLARDGQEEVLRARLAQAGAQPLTFTFDWFGVHLTKG